MSLFEELKRRNVIRIAAAYIVAAWLVIQVAETLFPLFGYGDQPARIVVIVLSILFIPAVILAWAFELTPDGLKRDREVERSQSIAPKTGKRLDRIIMVVLAVALGFFAFDKFVVDPQRKVDIAESATVAGAEQAMEEARLGMFNDKSVAVLPFANRSEQKEDEYFTDGMHDELLTRLSRIAALKVISRTSVMRYRDTLMSIPDIAKELSVATILEGGVQRLGDQVRINVQLINAHTDEHLWAEIYDRKLTTDNLFAIQSEISTAIADALQATLSPTEKVQIYDLPTSSMDAYNHFLRGRQLMASRKYMDLTQAREEFVKATEIDPEFALAWVGVADVVDLLEDQSAIDITEYLKVHRQAVDKALAINDRLGETYASLAKSYLDEGEREKAESAFLKAIELNPNYVQAYHWYAVSGLVSTEESLQLLYKAAQIDPMSSIVQRNIASALGGLGRIEEGKAVIQSLLQRDPTNATAYGWLGHIAAESGELAEAIQTFRKALPLDPGNGGRLLELARIYLALGDFEAVADIRAEMDKHLGPGSDASESLKYETLVAQSKWQEGIDWLAGAPEDFKATDEFKMAVFKLHYFAGDFEKALYYRSQVQPFLAEREQWQQQSTDRGWYPCEAAGMMIAGGKEALGHDLLQLAIKNLEDPEITEDPKNAPIAAAACYLLAGATDKSLNMLEHAMTSGIGVRWWYDWGKIPWWKRLEEHPRFIALFEQLESRLARQRALLTKADIQIL